MNKKNINILIFLTLLVGVFIIFNFLNNDKEKVNQKTSNINTSSKNLIHYYHEFDGTHNGEKIENILNKDNYNKIGIDPEKYDTFGDFLEDFKSFSGVEIDPINENFTIGIKKENGNILYVPFKYLQNKELFDNKINKNLAILDIYQAYKNGMIYGGINSKYGNKVIFENENFHRESEELAKVFNREVNVFNYIESLKKTQDLGKDKKELLSYLQDFIGNYKESEKNRLSLCKEYNICEKDYTKIILTGKITDSNNSPLEGVKIELLNKSNIFTTSDKNGEYKLEFNFHPFSHLRFKASKLGYSDGFNTYSLNQNINYEKKLEFNFILHKYHKKISLNKENIKNIELGGFYVIEVEGSKYFIPKNGLYYLNGEKYNGNNFDIYTYQFTKWSNMENLLENDTFEPVYGYVGNIMKTFGMPYIQFFDRDTKQELFVKSSNPMILQNQIYHMKELYENYDQIYEAVTQEDMEILYKYSQENEGFPIDFEYLTKNNFLRWPARWSLDRITGIWSNVGHRLLDKNGLVELPFYHIKDN